MSSSRTVGGGGDCLGPDGKPDGASCLASAWSDNYFETIQNFITVRSIIFILLLMIAMHFSLLVSGLYQWHRVR